MQSHSLLVQKNIPKSLFRSAPLAADSDFSAEDPLAFDYLGQQVGNWLFRGFTSRTGRAQYYPVVLYGLHLAEVASNGLGDDETRKRLFERWERFWALATLEFRGGEIERGDPDAMRGVLGAKREWKNDDKPLRIDFPLISRQLELGGLGAYLSSLRDYKLVGQTSLKPTPYARKILDAFWAESGQRAMLRQEKFALHVLSCDEQKIPRRFDGLTLRGIGELSRLSAILNHPEQQSRLWNTLFQSSTDGSTLPLALQLIEASKDEVVDVESLLEGMLIGQWGPLPVECVEKITVALAFGRLARFLLGCFDRAYECVHSYGIAARCDVSQAAFPDAEWAQVRPLCQAFLDAADSRRFNELAFHGPQFVALVKKLKEGDKHVSLEHILAFHRIVQKTRRCSGAWLRDEQGKLTLNVMSYTGYKTPPRFPNFKLDVVRQLLDDLGKL